MRIIDPLWQRWMAHALNSEPLQWPLQSRPEPPQQTPPTPSPEEIEATVWDSGLPHGFPFAWM